MPMKGSGRGELHVIDRFPDGAGWLAYPEEGMGRASHVLATEAGAYVVDPVDAEGVDDLVRDFGDPAGVVVALNRHERDAAAVADRLDVPVYVPSWMRGVEGPRVERFDGRLPGSAYRPVPVIDNPLWKEVALYDPGREPRDRDGASYPEDGVPSSDGGDGRSTDGDGGSTDGDGGGSAGNDGGDADRGATLYVPEAVGTAEYFRAGDERLGVHPALRGFPPRSQLGDLSPDRVLVGHGTGVLEDATAALRTALRDARRNTPSLYVKNARLFLSG